MHKGPKVLLTCYRPFSHKRYADHETPWCDVWLEYADQSYHDRRRRRIRKGPCLNSLPSLREDLAFHRQLLGEEEQKLADGVSVEEHHFTPAEMVDYYRGEVAEMEDILAKAADGQRYVIEEHDEEGIPEIYVDGPINRRGAEDALRFYLGTLGIRNPRFVWKQVTTFIHPLN